MNRPLLQTSLLERRYKTRHTQIDLFKQLSFEMSEKDTVSIMGASGSGKSTLLHIIGGLDSPDSGEILFRGDSIYKMGHRWLLDDFVPSRPLQFLVHFHKDHADRAESSLQ